MEHDESSDRMEQSEKEESDRVVAALVVQVNREVFERMRVDKDDDKDR
jgi:hypothetical protein